MLKNISKLEHVIGNRVYHLLVDSDSPIHEVKQALMQFLGYCAQVEEAVKAQQEQPKQEDEPLIEEVKHEGEAQAEECPSEEAP